MQGLPGVLGFLRLGQLHCPGPGGVGGGPARLHRCHRHGELGRGGSVHAPLICPSLLSSLLSSSSPTFSCPKALYPNPPSAVVPSKQTWGRSQKPRGSLDIYKGLFLVFLQCKQMVWTPRDSLSNSGDRPLMTNGRGGGGEFWGHGLEPDLGVVLLDLCRCQSPGWCM